MLVTEGLGLLRDVVVGVHFNEMKMLPHVIDAMVETGTRRALGIDEPACAVFHDEKLESVLGEYVHQIDMTDFADRRYTIETLR